jgi:polysaccharide export outer membrane protein
VGQYIEKMEEGRSMRSLVFAVLTLLLSVTFAAAQNGYRVQSGDVLAVEVLEDPSLNREVLVLPDGSISFPFAGSVQAGGNTVNQIAGAISRGIAGNFASEPNVFVTVRALRERTARGGPATPVTITVYFMGEVEAPGARELPVDVTFLQALSESGGLTNFAAERRIQIRRTDPHTLQQSVSTIDYRALSAGGRLSQDVRLADGDVILVPERRLFE